jgi:hypothetical protein
MKSRLWLAGLGAFCFVIGLVLYLGSRGRSPSQAPPPIPTSVAKPNAPASQTAAPFSNFGQWTQTYLATDKAARPALETEGIEWATARRKALAEIIENDPERAFEVAIPDSVRTQLPASVAALLEERVSAYGDYSVLAAMPLPGETLGIPAIQRSLNVDGRVYKAYVYGHRLDAPSKRNLPVHGIAIDDRIALHASAVQLLEPETAASLTPPAEQFCGVASTPLKEESVPVQVGSDIVWLCRDRHMEILREKLQGQAHQLAASSGTGSPDGSTEETPYTEGRKRVVMIRVAFSNLPTPEISSNELVAVHAAIDTYWRITSFGRTSLAELQRGSEIVQVTMPATYETYNDRAIPFRDDLRAVATAQGIDLSKFDFDVIYTGSGRPAFDFGGLGYVGAPGSWVVRASRGISCHELGHNLGFPHANFWDTGGQSAIGPGGNQEYGDPYDVMGGGDVSDGTGPGHYVSKFKWRIGWLLDAEFPRLTAASNTVRIYAHDNPDSRGIRGVRFRRDAAQDYFLEFRQRYTANQWLMNGIGLRWGSASGSGSQLIDTTPGTPDGKNDSAIVIGRTFSDPTAPVHITPLGFGNTYPPSIDVRVNIGTFPGNLPPIVSLGASAENTGIGGTVTLTANATDPNGDPLAYWWDLGDGTLTISNSPVITKAWTTIGEYKVRCVVSDMKGGTTSESIVITVGAPTTFSISGRVLYRGSPLADVLVRASSSSSSRYAYTDSDGTYNITRLAAGSYTVTALLHPYTFVNPFFSNPVTVGPGAESIDFIGVDAPQNDVTLVPMGATWRYLDNGSDQGTAWIAPAFADGGWSSGAAELGYGDGDEATVISYGSDPNNTHITYYFRRAFNVANPASLTNFVLNLLRDDGGIVYLNGVEILRDNLPAGTVNYRTLAVDNSEGTTAVPVDPTRFVAGQNVLTVEIHQVAPDSSDVSFNLSLLATSVTNFTGINAFYISQPANNAIFSSPANIDIAAQGFSTDDSYSLVEFYGDGAKLGEDDAAPFSYTWNNPAAGLRRLTAVATLAGGSRLTSAPVNITITAPALTQTLTASNAVWRYNDDNVNLGTAWIAPAYSDVNWSNGPAPLGFGDPGMGTTIRSGRVTHYFRNSFTVEDAALVTNLTAKLLRDDGAVIYINGVEATRVLMPATTITFSILASQTVDLVDETIPVILNLPASLLQDGANTVAVELHQSSAGSSDARFGLELVAQLSAPPTPGVRITSPVASTVTLPDTLAITATAVGDEITGVEFYRDGTSLGVDSTVPYGVDWQQPQVGTWTLTAIAREAGGSPYTSAPVVITFTAPRTGRQLISTRSLWRYFDGGSDLGTTWSSRTYNDSSWSQGYARLGYGNDGESTVVSYGPDVNKRYVTTYLRHAFNFTTLPGINGLGLSISRDDGAVVYLNGVEIFRSNLRPGLVSYNSLAAATINRPDETNFLTVTLPTAGLLIGTNVVAVEVHQDGIGAANNDLGFDLALVALANTNTLEGVYLTSPGDGARVTLPGSVQLAAFASVPTDPVNAVDFYADAVKVGEDTAPPYEADWTSATVGSYTLTAVARLASGNQLTSPPVHIVVQGPPIMISQVVNTVIPFGGQWKYWNTPVAPPPDWTSATYADAAWPEGTARFGFGLDGERTTLPSGRIAYYFRRAFEVANPALIEELIFQLQRDDGAVVYINGVEAFRSNMPAGGITSTTLAAGDAQGLDEQQAFIVTLPASGISPGTNIIAVEVHQSAVTSSDIGFDLHLTASGDTAPRILLSRPANGTAFVLPASVDIEAAAWPGQSRQVNKVEFFGDGVRLGEATTAPYVFQWPDVPQGNHVLFARMTDDFGDVLQSRTVNISVGHQVIRTNFIAAGSVWKYRDIGSNEGVTYALFTYNDAAWASGPAQLGYGDGDEATIVSFGPSSTSKYITTYFRRFFEKPAGWTITNISFRLMRDDGAVVWLNAREQFRSNMPTTGIINNTILASSAVDAANESTYFESSFTITNLPATNLVAVEIHQSSAGSSDISFDLEVVGTGYVTPIARPRLNIVRLPEGPVRMTWPATNTGWFLYSSPSVSGDWSQSSEPVGMSNNVHNVIVNPGGNGTFYQLRRP